LLRHLEDVGFPGAPRSLGLDEQGRVVLTFLEGDVGIPPYPAWTADDGLLESVAALQRQLHAAVRTFRPPPDARWDTANLPPPGPGAIVCHNDLCVENVVVRDAVAVGFIDFDFAAPADPLLDIAIAARHWIPFRDPIDMDDGRAGVDQVTRFRRYADVHGLDSEQRARVIRLGGQFLDRALVSMRRRAEQGIATYAAVWDAGYADQNRRSKAWLLAHAAELASSGRQ
jgi:aminoglycoside phosphotransferase (APT) family kinase protein